MSHTFLPCSKSGPEKEYTPRVWFFMVFIPDLTTCTPHLTLGPLKHFSLSVLNKILAYFF